MDVSLLSECLLERFGSQLGRGVVESLDLLRGKASADDLGALAVWVHPLLLCRAAFVISVLWYCLCRLGAHRCLTLKIGHTAVIDSLLRARDHELATRDLRVRDAVFHASHLVMRRGLATAPRPVEVLEDEGVSVGSAPLGNVHRGEVRPNLIAHLREVVAPDGRVSRRRSILANVLLECLLVGILAVTGERVDAEVCSLGTCRVSVGLDCALIVMVLLLGVHVRVPRLDELRRLTV